MFYHLSNQRATNKIRTYEPEGSDLQSPAFGRFAIVALFSRWQDSTPAIAFSDGFTYKLQRRKVFTTPLSSSAGVEPASGPPRPQYYRYTNPLSIPFRLRTTHISYSGVWGISAWGRQDLNLQVVRT